jgi:hypothetical protein
VKDIGDLCEHNGNPEKGMVQFCKIVSQRNYYTKANHLQMAAFYVFTGVVACNGDEEDDDYLEEDTLDYGPEFAAYIKEHNLGALIETPGRWNRLNHPTHKVKVWVWAPSETSLTAWYNSHGGNVVARKGEMD